MATGDGLGREGDFKKGSDRQSNEPRLGARKSEPILPNRQTIGRIFPTSLLPQLTITRWLGFPPENAVGSHFNPFLGIVHAEDSQEPTAGACIGIPKPWKQSKVGRSPEMDH
jgi:hypothetical protein